MRPKLNTKDLVKNIQYACERADYLTMTALAAEIGIPRATFSRIFNGKRAPNLKHLQKISKHLRCRIDDLRLPHAKFKRLIDEKIAGTGLPLLLFRTTKQFADTWAETSEKYKGQYIMYNGRNSEGTTIASLVSLGKPTKEGIEFSLTNPYRDSGNYTAYEYSGLIFPVGDFLYGFAEQKLNRYELLSVILYASRTPEFSILRGLISGIGVKEGASVVSSSAVILVRQRRPIRDWRAELDRRLGYIPTTSLPVIVQRFDMKVLKVDT